MSHPESEAAFGYKREEELKVASLGAASAKLPFWNSVRRTSPQEGTRANTRVVVRNLDPHSPVRPSKQPMALGPENCSLLGG